MLIPLPVLIQRLGIKVRGILHIGAHECEELGDYLGCDIPMDNIYWIEAMSEKVDLMKSRIPTLQIYQAVVTDVDDEEVTFYVTNNGQSSSILEFGTHAVNHSDVVVSSTRSVKTTRMDTLIPRESINMENLNFINLDIQGAELKALKGMESYLDKIDYIYTEVNIEEVYKGCCKIEEIDAFLEPYGFKRVAQHIYKRLGWGDAFYMKV
jgi:FkbM family methyltransferase